MEALIAERIDKVISLRAPAISEVNRHHFFLSDEEWELFEERAAIMEYEGGLSRQEAEERAMDRVLAQRTALSIAV